MKKTQIPYKAILAETIGAYLLTGMILHTIGLSEEIVFSTPFTAALTLAIMVATIGPISGAHINPAVTITLTILKKITWQTAMLYIIAQTTGAIIASFMITQILLPDITLPQAPTTFNAAIAEMLGTGLLMWGISAVIHKKQEEQLLAPLIIGGALLLGIIGAIPHSLGILNPAVALTITGTNLLYLLCPITGATISALIYQKLIQKNKKETP